jgi:hypothetical protein
MAYKSQVTNKYMGATFKGAPKSNTVTELGQIVDALRQDLNPALNKFASAKVDKQQAEANLLRAGFKSCLRASTICPNSVTVLLLGAPLNVAPIYLLVTCDLYAIYYTFHSSLRFKSSVL